MIELDEAQRFQLARGKPVNVVDDQTAQHYVVMTADLYARVRRLLFDDSEWTDEELRMQLARSAKGNGWDEPGMDLYDRYDEELAKRCK